MHNLDDYAWYEVGDKKYYNKTLAINDHIRFGLPIRWNANDAEYDRYNWSVEPTESLEFLYAQRAQKIREKYDYLVLHFSGGSDCGNILETFINNNIHLDEILIRGSYSVVNQKTGLTAADDQYGECMVQGLPLAQWVKDNYMPHVKINLVDTTDKIYNFYAKNHNWMEVSSSANTPSSNVIKGNLDLIDPEYNKMAERGVRIAHIIGAEKPLIFRNKNYFYTKALDTMYIEWIVPPANPSLPPQYVELFYWGKNAIPLQIKQVHQFKNYIKQHKLNDHDFDRKRGRVWERLVANILYKRTLPLLSEHEKDPSTHIIKCRDSWFALDQYNDAFVNYRRGIEYLSTLTTESWLNTQNNFWDDGIKGLYSKPRFLGT